MKKILLLTFVCMLFIACSIESIDNYKSCVVIHKEKIAAGYKMILSGRKTDTSDKPHYDIYKVFVYEYDYNRYNVGDTIK